MQYLINENGQYVGAIDGTASEILDQTPENCTTTVLIPPRSTDYWNGSNWTPIGDAPAYYFKFDYATKAWVDTRDIASVKNTRWQAIKLARNKAEFSGFTYNRMRFDSDQISQGRILAAYMFGKQVSWTLANDEIILLSPEDIIAVATAMAEHVITVHEQARLARIDINEATSIEEVEAVLYNGF